MLWVAARTPCTLDHRLHGGREQRLVRDPVTYDGVDRGMDIERRVAAALGQPGDVDAPRAQPGRHLVEMRRRRDRGDGVARGERGAEEVDDAVDERGVSRAEVKVVALAGGPAPLAQHPG